MFKNKTESGKSNLIGDKIRQLRQSQLPKMSQRILSERMQLLGIDVDKNAIQRLESGERFVTDIELVYLAQVLKVSYQDLLTISDLKQG